MIQDETGDSYWLSAADGTSVGTLSDELIHQLRTLEKPFARQAFVLSSITVVGPNLDRKECLSALVYTIDNVRPHRIPKPLLALSTDGLLNLDKLHDLYRRVREACGGSPAGDLLVAPADILGAAAPRGDQHFQAIAVAVTASDPRPELDLNLRRGLFDGGLVGLGRVALPSFAIDMFLASGAVSAPEFLDGGKRGRITMSSLGKNGRFGNQLFQYAFMKLYGLRHGVTMAVPDWPGRKLFGLKDPSSERLELPDLAFKGFLDEEAVLWEAAAPPMNVDFWGYFQEIPTCWLPHRGLLKTMFSPPAAELGKLDRWCRDLTGNGRRTLVAIHIRRSDYFLSDLPWFQIIPHRWYVEWLQEIWPTLPDPVLFVATDDPFNVLPHFAEFSPKSLADLPRSRLPDHIRDFEILRRADYLAICNSSFSRMAAILAADTQHCFLPSLVDKRLVPHQPWSDSLFWANFETDMSDPWKIEPMRTTIEQPVRIRQDDGPFKVYVDVTDLLFHLRTHSTVSGIQRVQCELVRSLKEQTPAAEVDFAVFSQTGLAAVAAPLLLGIIDNLDSEPSPNFKERIRSVLDAAVPAHAQPGDLFLTTGAFWAVDGVGRHVWQLKDAGLTIGVFVHDILPISRPEYFEANAAKTLVKPVVEVLALADFLVTSSQYNKAQLITYRKTQNLPPVPIDVVPRGHGLPKSSINALETNDMVASLIKSEFVLCVGTIETRKNPSYLLNIWKLMADQPGVTVPTLVLAGRRGWLVEDFLGQLKASNNLDGRIVLLHDLSDQTLELLYSKCLLTIFPSFDEGWGLPVGESLVHGKVCLASNAGGIPEVGGSSADYIDPYNVRDGFDQLIRYLEDPGLRILREKEIADQFSIRSWHSYAVGIMNSVKANLQRPSAMAGARAIALPSNEFLAIGKRIEGNAREAVRGYLSAEAACIHGWSALEDVGIAGFGPVSILRFRVAGNRRTKVTLILRLTCTRSKSVGLSLRPEFGISQQAMIKRGSDLMATVSCESAEDGTVTVYLERPDSRQAEAAIRSAWILKGFLYFEPGEFIRHVPTNGSGQGPNISGSDDREPPNSSIRAAISPTQSHDVDSLDAFLTKPNSNWLNAGQITSYRREPLFIDADDRRLFMTRYRNAPTAQLGAVRDDLTFRRRSDQFVSMSRFTEGAVFDASGVAKDLGYIKGSTDDPPWLVRRGTQCWIEKQAFDQARHLDGRFAIFFNGNLHNYYHWVAEGLLALDVLTQTVGQSLGLKIVLPQTMDINAALDHRASIETLGFGDWPVVEMPPQLVHVDEAVWLDGRDFIEGIPAAFVKRFQKRLASLHAKKSSRVGRRLLVKRLGATRTICNFEEVEAFLHPLGFETVWLEGASIEEQVLMFQRAEFVVGAHGAGLTNLLFCEPGTKVIEFMPTSEMRPFFWVISEKLGLRHGMQFCPSIEGEGFQAAIDVDIQKLRNLYDLVDSHR